MIDVLFFAGLKQQVGTEKLSIERGHCQTVAQLRDKLIESHPDWQTPLTSNSVKVAVNQTLANVHTTINDHDEVAFFPPMTGG